VSPPAWFLAALLAMQALHVIAPGPRWLDPPWTLLGLVPSAGGALLHAVALCALRSAGATPDPEGRPSRLVQRGPYAHTRNPMYLAGLPILLGFAALLGTLFPALVVPAYCAAAARWVAREEAALARRLGAAWEDYRAAVPRWL
jgi:protein-S-isoprenylcysteine O-methyltransferase Ste14